MSPTQRTDPDERQRVEINRRPIPIMQAEGPYAVKPCWDYNFVLTTPDEVWTILLRIGDGSIPGPSRRYPEPSEIRKVTAKGDKCTVTFVGNTTLVALKLPVIRRLPRDENVIKVLTREYQRYPETYRESHLRYIDVPLRTGSEEQHREKGSRIVSRALSQKRSKAGKGHRKVKNEGDRKKLRNAFRKYRKQRDTDNATATEIVKLAQWNSREKNYLKLDESYPDITNDDVKRLAKVKE